MKIVFFGTSDFAVPALEALAKNGYEISAVVTAPDKPAGRKRILAPSPIKVAAQKLGCEIFQPTSLKKDGKFFEKFRSLNPEMAVVVAYGKIIPGKYLSIPKYGFINVHPSLLPKYRGPTPIQSALLNGDKETAVTIMVVDEEMDHGPILVQEKYDIWSKTTYTELHDELADIGAELLIKTIPDFVSGKTKPREQAHDQATFVKLYEREDGKLDWSLTPQEIYNRIRALNPEPGTWTTWKGKVLNIKKAALNLPTQAGERGQLEPLVVQLEGGKEMPIYTFLNGHPDFKLEDCQ